MFCPLMCCPLMFCPLMFCLFVALQAKPGTCRPLTLSLMPRSNYAMLHVYNPHHHRACVQPSPSSHLNRACSLRLNLHSRRIIVAGCLKNTPPLSTRSQCDRHRTATPCSRSARVCQHASKHVGAHETLTVQTNDRMFARVAVIACCCACAELCVCGRWRRRVAAGRTLHSNESSCCE